VGGCAGFFWVVLGGVFFWGGGGVVLGDRVLPPRRSQIVGLHLPP